MKAAQLVAYGKPVEINEVPEPTITDPLDVIVRVGGAAVCRTDLHLVDGIMLEALGDPALPYTLGHETAGWVEEVGSAVTGLAEGDPVIMHPLITCGLCRACRTGYDMACETARFPGLDGTAGGFAE